MNSHSKTTESATARLIKSDPHSPALKATGRNSLVIKAGTIFAGHAFADDTPVPMPLDAAGLPGFFAGADYIVTVKGVVVEIAAASRTPGGENELLGGFHYAPGGNAEGTTGGDDIPAINPCSLWDVSFRPACPDPRGMTLVKTPSGRFWCDIYLTGVNHAVDGTSKLGATILDGASRPFDYETARDVIASHGKTLLSVEEFFAAAYGVTERTAIGRDPEVTKLDAPRTSRFGLMQATGNLWIWGHDGHPDIPRASIFGGSWLSAGYAGSRCAVVDYWSVVSSEPLGARGRSDHLQLD